MSSMRNGAMSLSPAATNNALSVSGIAFSILAATRFVFCRFSLLQALSASRTGGIAGKAKSMVLPFAVTLRSRLFVNALVNGGLLPI